MCLVPCLPLWPINSCLITFSSAKCSQQFPPAVAQKTCPNNAAKETTRWRRREEGKRGGEDSEKHMPKHRLQLILCMFCPALQLLQCRATVPTLSSTFAPCSLSCLHLTPAGLPLLLQVAASVYW